MDVVVNGDVKIEMFSVKLAYGLDDENMMIWQGWGCASQQGATDTRDGFLYIASLLHP